MEFSHKCRSSAPSTIPNYQRCLRWPLPGLPFCSWWTLDYLAQLPPTTALLCDTSPHTGYCLPCLVVKSITKQRLLHVADSKVWSKAEVSCNTRLKKQQILDITIQTGILSLRDCLSLSQSRSLHGDLFLHLFSSLPITKPPNPVSQLSRGSPKMLVILL